VLDLLKLKTFRVVAATNNFTRAATELGYCQSSVTLHIQALEREIGAPLFDRISRNVVLTDVGRRTLEYAERLLALADEARLAVHQPGEPSGPLSMSATDALVAYRLPEVLHQFQILCPRVELTLVPPADSETQIAAVLEGTVDLAFVVDEPLHDERLTMKSLGEEQILIVAPPDHRLAAEVEFKLENLIHERVLVTGRNCPFRLLFERALIGAHASLKNMLVLESLEAIKQCTKAGMGLAVLPKMAVTAELKRRRLVALPWPGPAFPVRVQIIRHAKRTPSPSLHALWRLAEQSVRMQV
jgi:DNA-binding transcriptional LysR family regulator